MKVTFIMGTSSDFSAIRFIVSSLSILIGGGIGALPGVSLWIFGSVVKSTGPALVTFYKAKFIILLLGVIIGGLLCLALSNKLFGFGWPSKLSIFYSGLGMIAAIGLSFVAILISQNTRLEFLVMTCLIPVIWALLTMAGFFISLKLSAH